MSLKQLQNNISGSGGDVDGVDKSENSGDGDGDSGSNSGGGNTDSGNSDGN